MSWLGRVAKMSERLDDRLGTLVEISGWVSRPNERQRPDPSRPTFRVVGIYHENTAMVGDGIGMAKKDGLHETKISATQPFVSVRLSECKWKPTQGDRVYVSELGRTFRILDIEREMHTRSRLMLEALEALPL